MEKKDLNYLLKYASPFSLLIVSEANKVLELKCPFKVKVTHKVGILEIDTLHNVHKLKLSDNSTIVYVIDGKFFHYYNFDICI